MAVCKFCGRYHDQYEWPVRLRPFYKPECCSVCFENGVSEKDDDQEDDDADNSDEDD